jgi:putative PIN family toxin of toxin-antitoxin system
MVCSEFILAEVAKVLRYPRLRLYFGLTDAQIDRYVGDIRDASVTASEWSEPEPVPCRDPNDLPIIRAAIGGRVNVLCTNDKDLLTSELVGFLAAIGIATLNDIDFLRLVRGS